MENPKNLVLTVNDGSIWKVPISKVRNHLIKAYSVDGDIDITEAKKQVDQTPDRMLMAWVRTMNWTDIQDEATQVDGGHCVAYMSFELKDAKVELMTDTEIDRFQTLKRSAV